MGLNAKAMMPTIKVINRFIFIPQSSLATYMPAIARPRDFAVLPKT
jgi:hypothetical protein